MRRLILALTFICAAAPIFGVLAPAAVHAQTAVPAVSANPTTVQVGQSSTVSGTGFTPNYYAYIYFQRPDGTTNAFYIVTDNTGSFSFTLGFLASHGTGSEYLQAYDYGTGRYTNAVTFTVTSTAPPPTTPQISVNQNVVTPGQVVTITGTGFSPNNYVYFAYQRPDGTTNAFYEYTNASGQFSQQLGFLASHGCGPEYVQSYNYGTSMWSNLLTITVSGCP